MSAPEEAKRTRRPGFGTDEAVFSKERALKLLSTASHVAFQIGGEEARRRGSEALRPAHVLLALCRLCAADLRKEFEERGVKGPWQEAEGEVQRLRAVLDSARLDPAALERRLAAVLDGVNDGTSMRSSDAGCPAVLALADKRRIQAEAPRIQLVHLLAALAQQEWAPWLGVLAELGVKREELQKAAVALGREPDPRKTRLPSVEAVMVMDLCGSTELGRVLGDRAMLRLKRDMKGIVEAATAARGARFTKGTGDGFLVTFGACEDAAAAAVEILERLRDYNRGRPGQPPLDARFGIDYGEVYQEADGDRSGSAVNLAFRVEGSKAEGMHETASGMYKKAGLSERNRILLTHAVFKKLSAAKSRLECLKVGYFDYKGFEGLRVAVYAVYVPDLCG